MLSPFAGFPLKTERGHHTGRLTINAPADRRCGHRAQRAVNIPTRGRPRSDTRPRRRSAQGVQRARSDARSTVDAREVGRDVN